MMLRLLLVLFTAIAPLSAVKAGCCNKCETTPSAAALLEALQLLLADDLLLLPQIQPLLASQLSEIITTNGVVPPVGRSFGDFFALMPGDNAATVAPGTAVSFPQNGPSSGGVVRANATTFVLPNIGTYQVFFQVSVTEPGQLVLVLNGNLLAPTVVGRATGTSQITGMSFVTTTSPNSLLQVQNPVGNSTALTITPVAGGTHSVSAHLVILQIQ